MVETPKLIETPNLGVSTLPDEDIFAYTVQDEPLTKEMYIKKVKDAEASVKAENW